MRLQCWECGLAFYGRADALYCSAGCKQRAYRRRERQRAAVLRSNATVEEARRIRQEAADIRRRARAAREAAHTAHHRDA
ncbi:hypothetical protein [Mycobacterium sp. 4D054]|uniref:hypothetical protein n=1 Tax=Mycobacterium sp. 4D054 TaxID=3457440 RepID=UPI003FD6A07D